jgi:hypothetical protein
MNLYRLAALTGLCASTTKQHHTLNEAECKLLVDKANQIGDLAQAADTSPLITPSQAAEILAVLTVVAQNAGAGFAAATTAEDAFPQPAALTDPAKPPATPPATPPAPQASPPPPEPPAAAPPAPPPATPG